VSKSFRSYRALVALAVVGFVPGPALRAADADRYPDDAELVVVVNLKQVLNCAAIKSQPDALGELKEALGRFAGVGAVQKYLAAAGLDAFRDVERITYVHTGGKTPHMSFLVLDGAFDAGKLAEAAKGTGAGLRAIKSGEHVVYEVAPRGATKFYATLLAPSVLIAADTEAALADARGRSSGAKKSALKKELKSALEALDTKQSVAFVTTGTAFARLLDGVSVPSAENAIAFLQSLSAFSGGATLADGFQFQLAFTAESAEVAKKLADSASSGVKILLTLVQQNAEKDAAYRPVVDVVKALRFTSSGAQVLFRGDLTLDTVEKLVKSFPVEPPARDRK
jgi:hypothetical protein